jgi:hypothetical protein
MAFSKVMNEEKIGLTQGKHLVFTTQNKLDETQVIM